MEIWKDIQGYEGLYQVSNLGNVKSLRRNLILKLSKNRNNGYSQVSLHKNGVQTTLLVHRLVGMCFIKNPKNLPQINHKNEIKTDNRVENLEWCDNRYNCNYGSKNDNLKKKTNQYTKSGELVKTWSSLSEIQRKLGFNQPNLSNCCNGYLPQAYGFIWRYV